MPEATQKEDQNEANVIVKLVLKMTLLCLLSFLDLAWEGDCKATLKT